MKNANLNFDLDKIKFIQESIETDLTKVSILKTEDFNLDYPYIIDVEDNSYFYSEEEERNGDFDLLCKTLTENSLKYFY